MARIRSVHPGLFTDEAYANCSIAARFLAVGLWTEADDKGIFEWKPRTLKMRIFPADSLELADLLAELVGEGIIRRYEIDGRSYGAIRNFRKHQRPKKPNDVHPMPDEFRTYVGLTASSSVPVENRFRTSTEIGIQMEDGGWRMEEDTSKGKGSPEFVDSDGVLHDASEPDWTEEEARIP